MTYANVTDVAVRLGRPITDELEEAQVAAWLTDVEALIMSRLVDFHERVAAGTPQIDVVVAVEAAAVVRKVKNPDGYTSETVDDYTYRLNEHARRGELFLTDDEWDLLSPSIAGPAHSIRPGFEPDTWPSVRPVSITGTPAHLDWS